MHGKTTINLVCIVYLLGINIKTFTGKEVENNTMK
jgi:hypothetical protein